jgi:hypothetical protein
VFPAEKQTNKKTVMSLEQVKQQIDKVASASGFRCVPVSWEDASRGTVGGALSCWGGNISDVRLWEKSGKLLYTVRSDNWNERLGYVAAKDVAVVVGNHVPGGAQLSNVTLQNYLSNAKKYGSYAGLTTDSLSENQTDQILSIRFQTVFLPVEEEPVAPSPAAESSDSFMDRLFGRSSGKSEDKNVPFNAKNPGRVEFCTDVYNYNTHSDDNPRNLLLLCTAQGTSMQQDGAGTKKMFIHEVDPFDKIHRYWLEAERSKHKVGGAQKETKEEAEAAAARGKATATFIGTRAMGTRFNVQMLIQLPVVQKPKPQPRAGGGGGGSFFNFFGGCGSSSGAVPCSAPPPSFNNNNNNNIPCSAAPQMMMMPCPPGALRRNEAEASPKVGTSNAARVSRGSEEDTWKGLTKKDAKRDPSQHGTITVTMYYTVVGGIPSVDDVKAAVADLDQLYKACPSDKKLVDCTEITSELTVKNMQDITTKVTTQAYQPPVKNVTVSEDSAFPE